MLPSASFPLIISSFLVLGGCGIVGFNGGLAGIVRDNLDEAEANAEREKAAQALRAAPPDALAIYYDVATGKVGYHVLSTPHAVCGPNGAPWNLSSATITQGQLPSGLNMDLQGIIEGTPDQPGRWVATIKYSDVGCRGKQYPDQNVTFDFTVTGDAVPRL
jgi:Putative Ig domain